MAFLLKDVRGQPPLVTMKAGERVNVCRTYNLPDDSRYFVWSRSTGYYRESIVERNEFVFDDEYRKLLTGISILLSEDGTYPGLVDEIDDNFMIWVTWFKWGYDSLDKLRSFYKWHEASELLITPDECRAKFGGLPPNWGER